MKTRDLIGKPSWLQTNGLRLAWCSVALLLPLGTTGCSQSAKATTTPEETEKSSGIEVLVGNPVRRELTREIDQPGTLRPYEQTAIYTKIAGFAEEPQVDRGDWVKKGQLLLQVRLPEVRQQLAVKAAMVTQAEADLLQARESAKAAKAGQEAARADIQAKLAAINSTKADVRRWEAEDERAHRLVGNGVFDKQTADEVIHQLRASEASNEESKAKHAFSKAMFDQASAQFSKAEADIQVAKAKVEVAKADYEYWKDWLSYAEIRAPYDGKITVRHVNTGDFLQPANSGLTTKTAEPLYMMIRTDIMRLTLEVPELDANLIKTGDKAKVRFQTKNGGVPEIEATVTRDSGALDDRARTLTVEIFLKNPDAKFLAGTYANVTIFAKLPNVWTLPSEAILNDILQSGDRSYCFVVEGGKVHKTFLDIGARGTEGVQVLRKQREGSAWEPITGKEVVVVVNPKSLLDGQEVHTKDAATATKAE